MISREHLAQAFSFERNGRSLFVRPPQKMPVVDGIRAIAVLLVVSCHLIFFSQFFIKEAHEQFEEYRGWLGWMIRGDLGVDMFFVISGFLIGGILLREYDKTKTLRLKRFFIRRFLRLMPVYWYALLSAAVVLMFRGTVTYMGMSFEPNLEWIWTNLLYINNFFSHQRQFTALAHSWSLAVEEQFYFLCPLLILLYFRSKIHQHPVKTVLGVAILYLSIRGVARFYSIQQMISHCEFTIKELKAMKDPSLLITRSPGHFCLFQTEIDIIYDNLYTKYIALFIGVMAAYLKVFKEEGLKTFFAKTFRVNVIGLVALFAFLFNFIDIYLIENELLFGLYRTFLYQIVLSVALAYLILLSLYARGFFATPLRAFLAAKAWYPIAQLSYSIYLFHVGIIILTYEQIITASPNSTLKDLLLTGAPVSLIIIFIGSALAYLLIERPFMNLRSVFDRD